MWIRWVADGVKRGLGKKFEYLGFGCFAGRSSNIWMRRFRMESSELEICGRVKPAKSALAFGRYSNFLAAFCFTQR
jgi:hypothetical protein